MTSKQFIQEKAMLGDQLMRYSISGDTAFHILAYHYVLFYSDKVSEIPTTTIRRWEIDHNRIKHDLRLLTWLDGVVADDCMGVRLPEWYQFWLSRISRSNPYI